MNKKQIIEVCHLGAYSLIDDTADGINYYAYKTGLSQIKSSYIDYIQNKCAGYNLRFSGDTIYASVEEFGKLNDLRKELKKRFIVGPIQWTPIEFPENNYNTFSFGILPFVDISNGYKILNNVDIKINKEISYDSADLSENEFWKILSKRIELFKQNKFIGRIFFVNDEKFVYKFIKKEHMICDLNGGHDDFEQNLSPRKFIDSVLEKHKLKKFDIPELKLVAVPDDYVYIASSCNCVRDLLMRCCASNPISIELEKYGDVSVFSYDDEDYDYMYKHFSFFDKQFV